jgi:hypothetical protein
MIRRVIGLGLAFAFAGAAPAFAELRRVEIRTLGMD